MIATGHIFQSRYQIVSKIGDGGMQSVYRALDLLVGRDVALKTPLPGQAAKRFADSAKIAAMVNHQNIAKTYDYFEEEDAVYLIEELVDGDNLDDVVPFGYQIDINTAAHIMLSLAKGICASHSAGVVHRDLKPSNIICARGTFLDIVKVTDFGIATLTDAFFAEEAKSGELTKSTAGTIKGAIPYMSPEMLFRQPGDHPDKPSDIWSLGAMMFRILTGDYPFGVGMFVPVNVTTGNRAPWPDFMLAKAQFRTLASELQAIVESCLVVDPASRPTAEQIVTACEALCFSTAAKRTGTVEKLGSTYGRIRSEGGTLVHFHLDSYFGAQPIAVGSSVVFSSYPGTPFWRAHPVALLPPKA